MFVRDGIGPVLDYLLIQGAVEVTEAMRSGAQRVQSYAQSNAPWADRSGAARNGLTAEVYNEGGVIVLDLYHTADHGYWLELIQDGRFAIIMPTLEALGPEIIQDAGGQMMLTGGGF